MWIKKKNQSISIVWCWLYVDYWHKAKPPRHPPSSSSHKFSFRFSIVLFIELPQCRCVRNILMRMCEWARIEQHETPKIARKNSLPKWITWICEFPARDQIDGQRECDDGKLRTPDDVGHKSLGFILNGTIRLKCKCVRSKAAKKIVWDGKIKIQSPHGFYHFYGFFVQHQKLAIQKTHGNFNNDVEAGKNTAFDLSAKPFSPCMESFKSSKLSSILWTIFLWRFVRYCWTVDNCKRNCL